MLILSIETSCDETAAAVLKGDGKSGGFEILSNVVSSQVKIHAKWGGVVPNLAAREHLKNIIPVLDEALEKAGVSLAEIELVAVTQGPGLIPALLVGTNAAKSLAYFCGKPLLGVHHVEGHIFANYINKEKGGNINQFQFPILALVVSGGHTQLILMKDFFSYQTVGQTQDDAAGEAFDKIAKIMNLGYPGGPAIAKVALRWKHQILNPKSQINSKLQKIKNPENPLSPPFSKGEIESPPSSPLGKGEEGSGLPKISFPRPMINSGNLDFSFSGLKTAVLYFYEKIKKEIKDEKELDKWKDFICFEAQSAIVDVLEKKSLTAVEKFKPQAFFLAGGVAANEELREALEKSIKKTGMEFACPLLEYCGDNAAMTAVAAFAGISKGNIKIKELKGDWKTLEADANLELK